MKTFKKLLALALAVLLVTVCALPVMATKDTTYTLTMSNPAADHTYKIYQILQGDVAPNTDEETNKEIPFILSNVEIGNSGYQLPEGTDMKAFLDDLSNKTSDELNKFIADNYSSFTTPFGDNPGGTVNAKGELEWSDLPGGYYLVIDDTASLEEGDAASAVMVQVVGTTSINIKPTYPEVDKKIVDKNGNEADAADFAVGKKFDFVVRATVPSANLMAYANDELGTYKLTFNDTMSEGLTFDDYKTFEIKNATNMDLTLPNKDTTVTKNSDGTTTIQVEISDLFTVIGKNKDNWPVNDKKDIVIELVYTAHLNEKAVISASGENNGENINTVSLNYRNKPNTGEDGSYGDTPEKPVYVYTFELTGNKVDDKNQPLAGAKFSLYQKGSTTPIELYTVDGKTFAKLGDVELPEGTETFTKIEAVGEVAKSFTINGLPAGDYVLKEEETPAGYNTCEDIEFTIFATYPTTEGEGESKVTITPAGSKVVLTHTSSNEVDKDGNAVENVPGVETTIVNKKGSLLPSTGGIGTTLFYVIGGVLVVGAGVLLFTKRRMGSKG